MASGVIGTLIFIFLLAGSIRKAILTSNRKIEAQRQAHKRAMQAAQVEQTAPAPEQPRRKKKPKNRAVHPLQPTFIQENTAPVKENTSSASQESDEKFDLRKAIIMAEILKPKYDE